LATLRKAKGLTQDDLAAILGFGDSAVSNYETQDRLPKIADTIKLAEFLDVSLDYLACRSDYPYVLKEVSEESKFLALELVKETVEHGTFLLGGKPVAPQEAAKFFLALANDMIQNSTSSNT